MTDVEDVDFDALISDLKTVDVSEYAKSARLMIDVDKPTNDRAAKSVIVGALHAAIIKKSGCLDTIKVISIINNIDSSVIDNLKFKIAKSLNI